MDPQFVYDDLVLVGKCSTLRRALETVVDSATADGVEPSVIDKYLFLCALQGHKPSPCYLSFLEELEEEEAPQVEAAECHSSANNLGSVIDSKRGHLEFSKSDYIGLVNLLPILVTLPECDGLVSINLSQQQLTSGAVQLLCRALRGMNQLRTINVSYNRIGAEGVKHLLQFVLRHPSVTACNICGNNSIAPLTRRLADAVARNQEALQQA